MSQTAVPIHLDAARILGGLAVPGSTQAAGSKQTGSKQVGLKVMGVPGPTGSTGPARFVPPGPQLPQILQAQAQPAPTPAAPPAQPA